MKHHYDLTDEEFEQQFANCTLDAALFTHEAHLRLAWIHIAGYGPDAAILNITTQLIQYTEAIGANAKYNHTLTIAAISAVNHFMNRSSARNFKEFIAEFPELKNNFKELICTHYNADIFHSEIARAKYVEPDLMPFD